jgi:hypothetical protein
MEERFYRDTFLIKFDGVQPSLAQRARHLILTIMTRMVVTMGVNTSTMLKCTCV